MDVWQSVTGFSVLIAGFFTPEKSQMFQMFQMFQPSLTEMRLAQIACFYMF